MHNKSMKSQKGRKKKESNEDKTSNHRVLPLSSFFPPLSYGILNYFFFFLLLTNQVNLNSLFILFESFCILSADKCLAFEIIFSHLHFCLSISSMGLDHLSYCIGKEKKKSERKILFRQIKRLREN